MARAKNHPGGQVSAITFTNLKGGVGDRSLIVKGAVTFRPPDIKREEIDDANSLDPQFKIALVRGMLKMAFVLPQDSSWILASVLAVCQITVVYLNGLVQSFTEASLVSDPVELDLTEGSTNQLTFIIGSVTEV